MDKKKKAIVLFIMIIIICAVVFFLHYILSSGFIFSDDTDSVRLSDFMGSFKPADGIYIAGVLNNFFATYLPYKLDMHPSAFKSTYFTYIEAFFIISFALMSVNLLYRKLNFIYISAFFLSIGSLFYLFKKQPFMLFINEGFLRMLLSVFLWVLMFIFYRKYIETNKKRFLYLTAAGIFLSSMSGEFTFIITFVGFYLYFLISILKKEHKLKALLLFIAASGAAALMMDYSGGFTRKVSYFQNIADIILMLKDYIPLYLKHIILKYIPVYLILTALIVFINYKFKDNTVKLLTRFTLCTVFGLLVFFVSLISIGKTHHISGNYWLIHPDLHVMYSIVLFSFTFAFLNILTERNIIKEYIAGIIYFLTGYIMFFTGCTSLYYNNFFMKDLKLKTYKAEKVIRIAACKGKTAYLDKELLDYSFYWAFYHSISETEPYKLYETSPYIEYLNLFEKKNKITIPYIFTDTEQSEEEFKNNGGSFSPDELSKLDFNYLYKICK